MALLKSVMSYFTSEEEKPVRDLGRNDSCWCGSGKKFKRCHLHEDEKKLKNYGANCTNA